MDLNCRAQRRHVKAPVSENSTSASAGVRTSDFARTMGVATGIGFEGGGDPLAPEDVAFVTRVVEAEGGSSELANSPWT